MRSTTTTRGIFFGLCTVQLNIYYYYGSGLCCSTGLGLGSDGVVHDDDDDDVEKDDRPTWKTNEQKLSLYSGSFRSSSISGRKATSSSSSFISNSCWWCNYCASTFSPSSLPALRPTNSTRPHNKLTQTIVQLLQPSIQVCLSGEMHFALWHPMSKILISFFSTNFYILPNPHY